MLYPAWPAAQTAGVWMTASILAWVLFWVALDAWGDGRLAEQPMLSHALWLGPLLAFGALAVRLVQAGVRPWWRLATPGRVRRTTRAALLFTLLGLALFLFLETRAETSVTERQLFVQLLAHAGCLVVLLWVLLPYSTLLDASPEEPETQDDERP